MQFSLRNQIWIPLTLLVVAFLVPTSVFAHERRTVANGKYDVVVGWDVEPAYKNQKNAASIRISQAGSNPPVPVQGAEKTLKVQMRQGAATKEFALRAVFGQAGYYLADIVPTREGDYQWMFVGSINEDQVNEKFDSADGKFHGVETSAPLDFPLPLADPAQATAAASAAQADAQSARTVGYVGVGLGVLGLLAALAVWMSRPRATATVTRSSPERV